MVWECISGYMEPSPSVFPATVAYVPIKVPDEIGSVENVSEKQD